MVFDPHSGKLYAAGEYNYQNRTEPVEYGYEDDVVFIINQTNYVNNTNGNGLSQTITSNDIERIRLYGEPEEGKEGDMSSIAVYSDKIYAGIRYFQGGEEGVFVINNNDSYGAGIIDEKSNSTNKDMIKFIPLGGTGPDQILVDDKRNIAYASLEDDNFIAVINGTNNSVQEKIILQEPRAMSINPSIEKLYVASGDGDWFNVIDTKTNKVISATQIAHPVASLVNNITNQVYVVDCSLCDNVHMYDFINGTSIYELNGTGSIINWKTYEDVKLVENEVAINPFTKKLYAIGTDESDLANLYVIDLVQAHGSLRVIVTVENVPSNIVGQEVWIRVTSGIDAIEIPVIVPDADSFYTELQFETSEVDAGEPISGCVNFNEDLDFEECGYTTYSEDKRPELVDIYLRDSSDPLN
jgi:DNA-binding beta-propeller fold protein YncE